MKRILLAFFLGAVSLCINAQTEDKPDYVPGEVYMQLVPEAYKQLVDEAGNVDRAAFLQKFNGILAAEELGFLEAPFYKAVGYPIQHVVQFSIKPTEKTASKIFAFNQHQLSVYAEAVPMAYIDYVPDDLGANSNGNQWHLHRINAQQAWDISKGDKRIVVAIVDDALETTHPDITNNVWVNPGEIPNDNIDNDGNGYVDDVNGYDVGDNDSDPNPPNNSLSHGTHVGGISGATTDNEIGVASIGFNISLMAVRSHRSGQPSTSISRGYNGIYYAAQAGADIINCSWSGGSFSTTNSNVISFAQDKGCIIVAAMGNNGQELTRYPAAYNGVVSVAATANNDTKATFSNYANYTTISAPGNQMRSTYVSNTYSSQSGTSMASPLVAGMLALMKSHYPIISNQDLMRCLLDNAQNIDLQNGSFIGKLGAGRIDAYASLQCMDTIKQTAPPFVNLQDRTEHACPNTSITFNPYFMGGVVDSVLWEFEGGFPQTSTDLSPTIHYDSLGSFNYKCTAYNSYGTHTDSVVNGVEISTSGEALVAFFDFENGLNGWTQQNDNNAISWSPVVLGYGQDTVRGIKLTTFIKGLSGVKTLLSSPVMDWSDFGNVKMTFDFAYAATSEQVEDSLIIQYSDDGGNTFKEAIRAGLSSQLNVSGIDLNAFTPSSRNDWCIRKNACLSLDLRDLNRDSAVMIRLVHVSDDGGNNLYINNLSFSGNCAQYNTMPPAPKFIADKTDGCDSIQVQFRDNSDFFPTAYSWSFPGGTPATSTDPFPVVTYPSSGSYDVELEVSNAYGSQQLSFSDHIQVYASPTASISASDTVTCKGTPVTLTGSGGSSYEWSPFSGISSSTAKTITANPSSSITYNLKVTSSNGCSGTASIFIKVLQAPQAPQIFFSSGKLTLFPSTQVGVNYQWYFNGDSIPGADEESYTPWKSGQYSVKLTDGVSGCTDTSIYPYNYVSTGIAGLTDQLRLYPNPSTGNVNLEFPSDEKAVIRVWGVSGAMKFSKEFENTRALALDLQHLTPGMYVVELQTKSATIRKKLIIDRP